jgi:hypothetical protein
VVVDASGRVGRLDRHGEFGVAVANVDLLRDGLRAPLTPGRHALGLAPVRGWPQTEACGLGIERREFRCKH